MQNFEASFCNSGACFDAVSSIFDECLNDELDNREYFSIKCSFLSRSSLSTSSLSTPSLFTRPLPAQQSRVHCGANLSCVHVTGQHRYVVSAAMGKRHHRSVLPYSALISRCLNFEADFFLTVKIAPSKLT